MLSVSNAEYNAVTPHMQIQVPSVLAPNKVVELSCIERQNRGILRIMVQTRFGLLTETGSGTIRLAR